jgi:two-component sensor histidine kinase
MNEHLPPGKENAKDSIMAELARVSEQAVPIAHNRKLFGTQIPLPQNRDLQELTMAFNTLSSALHRCQIEPKRSIQNHTQMQQKTKQELLRELAESRDAEEQMRTTLQKRTLLLKEIHHRVKNNLQVVSSLLDMRSLATEDPEVEHILQDSRNQVKAVALVHESLYLSADLASISLEDYVNNLTGHLLHVYGSQAPGVTIRTRIDPVPLGLDLAMPCALLLNELVSNALIHAFPAMGDELGQIRVEFHAQPEDHFTLIVADSGVGLPPDFSFRNVSSLGLQLVNMLTQQLGAELEVASGPGTRFAIRFPGASQAGQNGESV